MKKIVIGVFAYLLLFGAPSIGQMMDQQMEKHMKEHMGGGMGSQAEGKEDAQGQGLTKEASEAEVTAKVTYLNPGEGAPKFKVVLDTHSVALDPYKFDEIVLLREDSGKEHHADLLSSTGSGHHREATVEFKDMDISSAKFVELVIEDVAGVPERVFRFDLGMGMAK